MTTIPTIRNRNMLKGLMLWNENHYERWKTKLCGDAGVALMEFISEESTEPGQRGYVIGDIKDYIPGEDVKEGDYTKLILKEGSRSFYMGLECMFQKNYNDLAEKSKILNDIDYLTLIGGCGNVEDWIWENTVENCLTIRKWYGWVGGDIPGYNQVTGCFVHPEKIKVSEERKEILQDFLDGPPLKTWWELAEYLEKEIKDIKKEKESLEENVNYKCGILEKRNSSLMEKNQKLEQQVKVQSDSIEDLRGELVNIAERVKNVAEIAKQDPHNDDRDEVRKMGIRKEWAELLDKVKIYIEDQF